jgi:hypothetical protein
LQAKVTHRDTVQETGMTDLRYHPLPDAMAEVAGFEFAIVILMSAEDCLNNRSCLAPRKPRLC